MSVPLTFQTHDDISFHEQVMCPTHRTDGRRPKNAGNSLSPARRELVGVIPRGTTCSLPLPLVVYVSNVALPRSLVLLVPCVLVCNLSLTKSYWIPSRRDDVAVASHLMSLFRHFFCVCYDFLINFGKMDGWLCCYEFCWQPFPDPHYMLTSDKLSDTQQTPLTPNRSDLLAGYPQNIRAWATPIQLSRRDKLRVQRSGTPAAQDNFCLSPTVGRQSTCSAAHRHPCRKRRFPGWCSRR
jgi:hypothetical protein